jgi:glycosyltransferase involved in cell wall biosynthesis
MQRVASTLMYEVKGRFDRAVSERLGDERRDVMIGMYGSAARTLATARALGELTVLNFVNSHPVYQNRFLRELGGLRDGHHELVAAKVAADVEREIEHADVILSPSRFVARQLWERGVPPGKVVIMPYGVDPRGFQPTSSKERVDSPTTVRCLFVGQIGHRKGVPTLLEAARRLRDRRLSFDLVGPIVSPEVLQRMPSNVVWRGPRVGSDVAETMRDADILVLPSLEDAYPLVTLEAMACGLPTIVSDHAGTSELITHGTDGFVIPAGNAAALADVIAMLVESRDRRHEIGIAARQRVEKGCSWGDYGKRVLSEIRERVHS